MQAVPECAGSGCRLFWSVQAVPEWADSGCRLFQSVQAVGAGSSRVCRKWVQAVPECAGSGCKLFQSVQAFPQCSKCAGAGVFVEINCKTDPTPKFCDAQTFAISSNSCAHPFLCFFEYDS